MACRITSEEQLERLRASKKNCIILLGAEPVITNETISLCNKYFRLHDFSFENITLDSNINSNNLYSFFSNGSLFSNRSLFNLTLHNGKISEDIKKIVTQSIMNKSDDFFIINVVSDPKAFKKNAWFKDLEEKSLIIEAYEPSPNEIIKIIKQRSESLNLYLSDDAIILIAEQSEGNLLAAENEIIKLSLIYQDRNIDAIELTKSSINGSKYDSFQLLDLCFSGKISETYKVITHLEEQGTEPLMINGLYAWIFRAIANIKLNNAGQYSQNDFSHFRVFGQSQNLVIKGIKNLSHKQIYASINKIKEIDLICKGLTNGSSWIELSRFVMGLSRMFNKVKV